MSRVEHLARTAIAWAGAEGWNPGVDDAERFLAADPDAFLATEQAKDITGQIFGVRGKEIMLFGQHRPIMRIHDAEGWSVEKLIDIFPGTLQHHLVPNVTSGQYFNYDPLV